MLIFFGTSHQFFFLRYNMEKGRPLLIYADSRVLQRGSNTTIIVLFLVYSYNVFITFIYSWIVFRCFTRNAVRIVSTDPPRVCRRLCESVTRARLENTVLVVQTVRYEWATGVSSYKSFVLFAFLYDASTSHSKNQYSVETIARVLTRRYCCTRFYDMYIV